MAVAWVMGEEPQPASLEKVPRAAPCRKANASVARQAADGRHGGERILEDNGDGAGNVGDIQEDHTKGAHDVDQAHDRGDFLAEFTDALHAADKNNRADDGGDHGSDPGGNTE